MALVLSQHKVQALCAIVGLSVARSGGGGRGSGGGGEEFYHPRRKRQRRGGAEEERQIGHNRGRVGRQKMERKREKMKSSRVEEMTCTPTR